MKNSGPHSHIMINNYTRLVAAIVGTTNIEQFVSLQRGPLDNSVLDHEFLITILLISVYPGPSIVPEKEQMPHKCYF